MLGVLVVQAKSQSTASNSRVLMKGDHAAYAPYMRRRAQRDNLKTHVSAAMKHLVAARNWLTVFKLPLDARELSPPGWSGHT